MKKLSLKLDDLRVESFDTVPSSRSRGTVRGQDSGNPSGYSVCFGGDTCHTADWCLSEVDPCDNPSQWPCSLDGPLATQCDLSCEFECTGETCEGPMC